MKVEQLANNQIVLTSPNGVQTFVSYGKTIATKSNNGVVRLDETYWNYSYTTSKYRNKFLGEKLNDTRKKIEKGEYKLTNLN